MLVQVQSAAKPLLQGGAGIRDIQKMIGHKDIEATTIYTRMDKERLQKDHKKFHTRG